MLHDFKHQREWVVALKSISIVCIEFYQKNISPHKGFRCAHAALYQENSCSAAIKEIIEVNGLIGGYRLIRQRLNDCKQAYAQLRYEEGNASNKKDDDKWHVDCCDPATACEVSTCLPKNSCDFPDIPDVCSCFG